MILIATMTLLVPLVGVDVAARITAKRMTSGSEGGTEYWLDYTFEHGGVSHSSTAPVTHDTYAGFTMGQATIVRILPLLPQWSLQPRFPNRSALPSDPMLLFGILFWNGIASVFVWKLWFEPNRVRWLMTHGEAAVGTVVSLKTETDSDCSKMYLIHVRYHVPAVDVESGNHSHPIPYNLKRREEDRVYASIHEGDSVVVLIDPRKPSRAILSLNHMFEILPNSL